jgi:hypothetical protein
MPLPRPHPLVSKSILPPSNAVFAQNALPEHIIYGPISAPTPMSDRLCAPSAEKPLLVSMTGNDMRDYILVKRNLFAEVTSVLEIFGAVVANSLVQMLWADIFDPKLVEYVSNPCLMKKLPKELETDCWSNSNSMDNSGQALCSLCSSL